jgi:hypothetical protein
MGGSVGGKVEGGAQGVFFPLRGLEGNKKSRGGGMMGLIS